MRCTVGFGIKPQKLGIFENFCVKRNLAACKVTSNYYRKCLGEEQDVLPSPQIIFWGATAAPAPPVPALMFNSELPGIVTAKLFTGRIILGDRLLHAV